MSGSLSRLNDYKNYYVNNFPTDVLTKAAQGFTASTILRVVFDNVVAKKVAFNGNAALLTGAMAATATIVEAVTRPMVRATLPDWPDFLRLVQIYSSRIITLGLAYSISPWIGVNYAPEVGFFTPPGILVTFFLTYSQFTMQINQLHPEADFYTKKIATLHLF